LSTGLVIVAAGMGTRLGANRPKALIEVGGQPLLALTLSRLMAMHLFDSPAVVTFPAGHEAEFRRTLDAAGLVASLVPGGAERQDSVRLALEALSPRPEIVAIHDCARPFVPRRSVAEAVGAAREHGGATVAIPATDTILEADGEGFLHGTPDRARMWACQTPQVFQYETILAAHRRAAEEQLQCTDDASLARHYGCTVMLVHGSGFNIKITRPEDLPLAQRIMEEEAWHSA
jgi:2-C-methyl-D-erythritol 4-phosphate cytidylyltransferase